MTDVELYHVALNLPDEESARDLCSRLRAMQHTNVTLHKIVADEKGEIKSREELEPVWKENKENANTKS